MTHYYKVLLVDDEAEIREGMAQRIPWETLGFKIIGTAGVLEAARTAGATNNYGNSYLYQIKAIFDSQIRLNPTKMVSFIFVGFYSLFY